MKRWSSAVSIGLVSLGVALAATAIAHDYNLADGAHTVTVRGMCSKWTAYRTAEQDLLVLCPGMAPPAGAVELRAYYVMP